MTFSNMLFEMQSKISLPVFILMGTFSYLGAMESEDASSQNFPSSSSYFTPTKDRLEASYQGSVDSDGSQTPQSPLYVRLGNNQQAASARVNAFEFGGPRVIQSKGLEEALSSPEKRAQMFGQGNLQRLKSLHAPGHKPVIGGRGLRRNSVTTIHQGKSPALTDSPLVSYPEIHDQNKGNDQSPGYVASSSNPYLPKDKKVLSPSVRRGQFKALALTSEISAEDSVAIHQRLDFDSDVPQELVLLRKKNEELSSLIQALLLEEFDPYVANDIDTTEINRNLDYAKSYQEYIQADSQAKEEVVESLMDDPDYAGLTIENAESYLLNKMVEGVPQVEQFFKKLRKLQKTAVQNAKQKHESCQQLAVRASNMLVTTNSVVNDMDARNSSLWNSLTGLVYKQDVLKYMNGKLEVSRDLVDSRNSSALINALEVLTNEYVKASAMNLNLTESQLVLAERIEKGQLTLDSVLSTASEERKMQNETIARLTRISEDYSQTIKDYSQTVAALTSEVSSLKNHNQTLLLKQESDAREKAKLQDRIRELERQLAQKPASNPKSTFGGGKK